MIAKISLILSLLLFMLIVIVVVRAIISKQKIIGKPPIPVLFFILAKLCVLINLVFLVIYGLRIKVTKIFEPPVFIEIIALLSLLLGVILLFQSTIRLNKDLIFGLSDSDNHKLQTRGIYSLSRHPFYLGFILILFSSCLFTPDYINLSAFIGAWVIHHFIMIKEEQSLEHQYGDEYRQYKKSVSRYVNLKRKP